MAKSTPVGGGLGVGFGFGFGPPYMVLMGVFGPMAGTRFRRRARGPGLELTTAAPGARSG